MAAAVALLGPRWDHRRRSSRLRSIANGFRVPSLPKLHERGPLVTTKLCESIHKSTAGHVFDLSSSKEHSSFTEYNSLHDTHLRGYYYRPTMKKKLISNGFIAEDLKVICSLKEYSAYHNFLEMEFMKLRRRQEEEKEWERRQKTEREKERRHSSVDKEREEKRRQFFLQQEKKLRVRQQHMRKMKRREEMTKIQALEERKMHRERNEIKREAEREQRRLEKLQQEHDETMKRSKLLHRSKNQDFVRVMQLRRMKQEERLKHMKELEQRWQKYKDHAEQIKEDERMKKVNKQEEREKRMRRREKLFQILQRREEERKKKLMEENHKEVEELKEQADKLEKNWMEKKNHEVTEWKQKFHRQQEHWQHHLEHQKEVHKQEAKKHAKELLSHSPVISCSRSQKISSSSYREDSSKSPNSVVPRTVPAVRFMSKPTVHVLDDPQFEAENETDSEFGVTDLEMQEECENGGLDSVVDPEVEGLGTSSQNDNNHSDNGSASDLQGPQMNDTAIQKLAVNTVDASLRTTEPQDVEGTPHSEASTTSDSELDGGLGSELRLSAEQAQDGNDGMKKLASNVVADAIKEAVERVPTPQ